MTWAPTTSCLRVVNTNGVLIFTTQQVVVVGLAIQWERFYGGTLDAGFSLVQGEMAGLS